MNLKISCLNPLVRWVLYTLFVKNQILILFFVVFVGPVEIVENGCSLFINRFLTIISRFSAGL